jgi:hypothetical protein
MRSRLIVMLTLAAILAVGTITAVPAFAHHRDGHTANCHIFTSSPFCQVAQAEDDDSDDKDNRSKGKDNRNNRPSFLLDDDDSKNDDSVRNTFVGSLDFSAQGIALTREGNGLSMADASLELSGNVFRIEGNHARADLSGELQIGTRTYDIDAEAKVKSKNVMTIEIKGWSFGEQRLILKGYLFPTDTNNNNEWTFVAQQTGKFGGRTGLYAMTGDAMLTATLPPTGDKNALSHFTISTIGDQMAGNEFTFTVTAINGFGNTKTDFTGTVTLSTNDGNSPNPSNAAPIFTPASHTFVAADNGQFAFKAKLFNAKSGVTITAASGGKTGTSNMFSVLPASINSVQVTPATAGVAPGGTQNFEAKAFDQYSNQVVTTFSWDVSPETGFGSVSPTSSAATTTFTAAASVTDPITGTVTASAGGKTGSSNVTVGAVPGVLHHFNISPIPDQVAGTPFLFTVSAKDNTGATITTFSGTVNITTNNGNSPAPSNTPPAFSAMSHTFVPGDNGQFTFAATMYNAKTGVTITATDSADTTKTGTSNQFTVSPAAINSITVTTSDASMDEGETASLEAKAFDQYSNQVVTTFSWDVSPETGFGSVSPTSSAATTTFTAAASVTDPITGTVTASAGGKTGSVSLTVNPV